jgi:hypothetical protein
VFVLREWSSFNLVRRPVAFDVQLHWFLGPQKGAFMARLLCSNCEFVRKIDSNNTELQVEVEVGTGPAILTKILNKNKTTLIFQREPSLLEAIAVCRSRSGLT